ncbi:response regulator [Amycolatopsis keratiniphila]|uniref:response regulator n=1 Tax=Amycolatopsis keratiniphila TaxID=129921 RepID=UPI00087B895C|nr:response regulator transcription factor [Amycolatopsis keratiniphila]OLZ47141.1 DNA-binding response regulator [Amycolatopsis keratiniphila subsp. nogabecina]SDU00016.1 DNA-binding response regulator, NarL/FixJ family, contains REC and HTH domains [Amycolatopsis keratiniphila]
MIRVLLADDEPLLRAGARLLLNQAGDIDVVAEASDGAEAIDVVRRMPVDVALMDIRMPGTDGLAAVEEIAREVRVIMLTTFGDEAYVARALRAGAAGFLLKDTDPAQLIQAVRSAAAGEAVLSPRIAQQVIDRFRDADAADADNAARARRKIEALTARELEVLVRVGRGLGNAEIAGELRLSNGTVKIHVSRILAKLGCANRVQAAILAHDAGILRG